MSAWERWQPQRQHQSMTSRLQEPTSEGQEDTYRGAVVRGSAWTIGGHLFLNLLRLGANVVLARLLFPEAFGAMLLIQIFLQGLQMLSDLGFGIGIVQSRRGEDPRFLDTAWTLGIARGILLWIASILGAEWMARFYEVPILAEAIPVVGFSSVLMGLASTKIYTELRGLSLGRKTVNETVGYVLCCLVMVGWASVDRSIWALVAGILVQNAVVALLSHTNLPGHRNRLDLERAAIREQFLFGRWIFVSTTITYGAINIDRALLGKLVPIEYLGVYGMATAVAILPLAVAGMLIGQVQFPVLSKAARNNHAELHALLLDSRHRVLAGTGFALLAVLFLSPPFFRLAYDDRYAAAQWMTPLMTLPAWFILLKQSADRAFPALGRNGALVPIELVQFFLRFAGGYLGYRLGGVAGFIIGLAGGAIGAEVILVIALRRLGVNVLSQDLRSTAIFLAFGIVAAGSSAAVYGWFGTESSIERSAVEILVGITVLVPVALRALAIVNRRK